MTLTDSNLRYLLAIHHLAQQNTEVSPLALAQVMGVTKPSVTSILTSLMKAGGHCSAAVRQDLYHRPRRALRAVL